MPYKDELKKDLTGLINQFFQEEMGNRVTSFSINGFCQALTKVLEKNQIKEETKEEEK